MSSARADQIRIPTQFLFLVVVLRFLFLVAVSLIIFVLRRQEQKAIASVRIPGCCVFIFTPGHGRKWRRPNFGPLRHGLLSSLRKPGLRVVFPPGFRGKTMRRLRAFLEANQATKASLGLWLYTKTKAV
jgi:hypothetical protein